MMDVVMDVDVAKEEIEVENSSGMTAVAVVGRAIEFFAKEGNRVVTSDAAAVDSSNATLARVLQ
jgi:hypothetical protein